MDSEPFTFGIAVGLSTALIVNRLNKDQPIDPDTKLAVTVGVGACVGFIAGGIFKLIKE